MNFEKTNEIPKVSEVQPESNQEERLAALEKELTELDAELATYKGVVFNGVGAGRQLAHLQKEINRRKSVLAEIEGIKNPSKKPENIEA